MVKYILYELLFSYTICPKRFVDYKAPDVIWGAKNCF